MSLATELGHFTGTERYYRYIGKLLLTDGVKYMADKAGCYWLLDIIASVQGELKNFPFQVWSVRHWKKGDGAHVVCSNGNNHEVYVQDVEYTDFPKEDLKIWVEDGGEYRVALLPSEH